MIEYIDVLDENGVKTGEILTRKEIHERGLWHRAIVVAILNEKNAGMWDISVAGHISSGQDSVSAAAREINEEVMIDVAAKVSVKDFRYMFSYRVMQKFAEDFIENQFYDFFILRKDGIRKKHIHIQESEVQAIKFASLLELEKILQSKEVVKRDPVYEVLCDYLYRY